MSFLSMLSNIGLDTFIKDDSKKFENGLFANGLWQRRKEPVGEFVVKMEELDGRKYGLKNDCAFSYTRALPLMPYPILNNILQFYRDIYKLHKSEVYVSVYWDKIKEDYFLYVPKQEVQGASVKFENDPEMLNNPDYVIVMDSHSHCNMSKCYS